MIIMRNLNEVDAAKLAAADKDVTPRKMALALQLLDADGRREQYEEASWTDIPPMFRWMVHKILEENDLRLKLIRTLQGGLDA